MTTLNATSRRALRNHLALLSGLLLIYTWPLQVLSGIKLAYLLFGALSLLFICFNPALVIHKVIATYILLVTVVFTLQLGLGITTLEMSFQALVPYLIIPAIYGRSLWDSDDVAWLAKQLLLCVPINVVGLLLQLADYSNDFLRMDQTITGDVVHSRYTSFLGGSLGLGFISFLNALTALYFLTRSQGSRRAVYAVLALMAVFCLSLSYSRRFYLLTLIGAAAVFYFWMKARTSKLLPLLALVVGAIGLGVFSAYGGNEKEGAPSVGGRLASALDLTDPGNALRVLKWQQSLQRIAESFPLGMGVGSVGTVGKSIEDIAENFEEANVAEMYYLHIAVDLGGLLGVFFIFFSLYVFNAGSSHFKRSGILPALICVLFTIESLGGNILAAPFSAMLFWMSLAALFRARTQLSPLQARTHLAPAPS